jgi:serine/threonine protein phosphatase PrpC
MHPENQDYLAVGAEGEVRAGVACDGVSRSQNSAAASELAAPACLSHLLEGVRQGGVDTVALMRRAIAIANDAVMSVPYSPQDPTDPAAATLAAALVQGRKVTVGWIGDSRVYFIGEGGSVHQLSVDHSYMAHLIQSGMSVKDALAHEDAHAITHSLGGGGDSKYQEGSVKVFNAPGRGYILICTDGFWNYAPESQDVAAVFKDLPKNASAVQIAKALVEFARLRGGADNITVILIAIV